jgi:A/G-specific adenine glycosylase
MGGSRDETLRKNLANWYLKNQRDLPWREESTPYRTMLSEFMLQQTRVDTVLDYFERFTRLWPTLGELAQAEEEEVVREWAGLGYYSRARNLHRCAVAAHQAGGLPSDPKALQELPGIGPYTAGAIASIGFQTRAALVDGNVERVLSRVENLHENPRSAKGKKALWARAETLLPLVRPGDFNQALMELGALVCTPRSPNCEVCPWVNVCLGYAAGGVESLPNLPKKKPPTKLYGAYVLLETDGKLVFGRRPATGLLAGMWEPLGSIWTVNRPDKQEADLIAVVEERASIKVSGLQKVGEVIHVFSHRHLTVSVYRAASSATPPVKKSDGYYDGFSCTDTPEQLGLSKLARKILELNRPLALFK